MSKIINTLFVILILLLPTQLGRHFWPEWSLVDGVRVDYLSPTVYVTDVILILLIAAVIINQKSDIRYQISKCRCVSILFMISYILFIIWRSPRQWLAAYWVTRCLEIPLAAWATAKVMSNEQKTENNELIQSALAVSLAFSVGLGIMQMVLGGTTEWFWWLGERSFTAAAAGVATLTVFGKEVMRPYATFGHPSALGGFLAVGTMILLRKKEEGRRKKAARDQWGTIGVWAGVLGVILTGSRGAIAALVIAALLKIQNSEFRIKILLILGGLGILVVLGNLGDTVKFANESLVDRVALTLAAARMWRDNLVIGVGPGQFLVKLPEYLPGGFYKIQPVHNIFLLGLTEFGIIGVGIMVITIIKIIKITRIRRFRSVFADKRIGIFRWLPVLAVILITGMVDHYWLTAQQNRLLLGVMLGLWIWGRQ